MLWINRFSCGGCYGDVEDCLQDYKTGAHHTRLAVEMDTLHSTVQLQSE